MTTDFCTVFLRIGFYGLYDCIFRDGRNLGQICPQRLEKVKAAISLVIKLG